MSRSAVENPAVRPRGRPGNLVVEEEGVPALVPRPRHGRHRDAVATKPNATLHDARGNNVEGQDIAKQRLISFETGRTFRDGPPRRSSVATSARSARGAGSRLRSKRGCCCLGSRSPYSTGKSRGWPAQYSRPEWKRDSFFAAISPFGALHKPICCALWLWANSGSSKWVRFVSEQFRCPLRVLSHPRTPNQIQSAAPPWNPLGPRYTFSLVGARLHTSEKSVRPFPRASQ